MQPRLAAAAVAAAVVAIAATGCNILTPQATTIQYDPSDGVSGSTGTVEMHNAMLVGEPNGDSVSLVVTFSNSGEATLVEVRYDEAVEQVRVGEGLTILGTDEQLVMPRGDDLVFGDRQNVSFQADGATPTGIEVPTISTEVIGYETLAPSAE